MPRRSPEMSPGTRRARGRVSAFKRHHPHDSRQVVDAERDLLVELAADRLRKLTAVTLTTEQRVRLASMIFGDGGDVT